MAQQRAEVSETFRAVGRVKDVTVKWHVYVLGFPQCTAKALYQDQGITGNAVLVDLTDKHVDEMFAAIQKPGGASQGDPTPVLIIEPLKLTMFYLQLFDPTSRGIPKIMTLDCDDILSVKDQKQEEED
jgi:hypothetical protein